MAPLYGGWPTCNSFLSKMFDLKSTSFVIFSCHFFPLIIIKNLIRLSLFAITKRRFNAYILPLKLFSSLELTGAISRRTEGCSAVVEEADLQRFNCELITKLWDLHMFLPVEISSRYLISFSFCESFCNLQTHHDDCSTKTIFLIESLFFIYDFMSFLHIVKLWQRHIS